MIRRTVIIRVIVFALLGAIVNIAVAWGCALTIDPYEGGPRGRLATPEKGDSPSLVVRRHRTFGGQLFSVYSAAGIHPAPGSYPALEDLLPPWAEDELLNDFKLHHHDARGWPCVSLYAALEAEQALSYVFVVHHGIETSLSPMSVSEDRRSMPCVTSIGICIGTAGSSWRRQLIQVIEINSGEAASPRNAAVLWIVFAAPGFVKRRIRRGRGRCIHCGYDLRGHDPGASAESTKCPECGNIEKA